MHTDFNQIARTFSRAAATYDRVAAVQQRIGVQLLNRLETMRHSPVTVLDAGCGTGKITIQLQQLYPGANITGLDVAEGFLTHAQKTYPDSTIHWKKSNLLHHHGRYDLIFSNAAMQWIQPLKKTVQHTASLLPGYGIFAATLMTEGTLKELHAVRHQIAPHTAPVYRLPTLQDICAALTPDCWQDIWISDCEWREHVASASEVLSRIKALGATGGPRTGSHKPLTRHEINELCRAYELRYRKENGDVPVTYRYATVMAVKKPG